MPKVKLPPLPTIRPILPRDIIRHDASGSKPPAREATARVPFFRDPEHKLPTKALYRRLIRGTRSAPHETAEEEGHTHTDVDIDTDIRVDWPALRRKVREDWKKRKGWTSIPQTHSFLTTQHEFLSLLNSPHPGIGFTPSSLATLSLDLSKRYALADIRNTPTPPRKPYLAGFLRPSHNNPPLPRLKPQPVQITLTIKSRIAARARRLEIQRGMYVQEEEIQSEMNFYRNENLRNGEGSKRELEDLKGYLEEIRARKGLIQEGYDRDERRKEGVYGVGVVRRVEEGKRKRQAWKRARAEERRAGVA